MKAIIRFSLPPVGCYYTLPVFENCPKPMLGFNWERWLREEEGCGIEKQYILTFRESGISGMFNQIEEWQRVNHPELTEDQIRKINELYFYMLDHSNLVEGKVKL